MDLDSIDEKTAFKLGFASRCFEMGLEPDQVKEAMEKRAILPTFIGGTGTGLLARFLPSLAARLMPIARVTGPFSKATAGVGVAGAGYGTFIAPTVLKATAEAARLGLALNASVGLAAGAGLGYGAAKLNEKPVDEDEIKSKELADTYKAHTARLKSQRAYQQYRKARERS